MAYFAEVRERRRKVSFLAAQLRRTLLVFDRTSSPTGFIVFNQHCLTTLQRLLLIEFLGLDFALPIEGSSCPARGNSIPSCSSAIKKLDLKSFSASKGTLLE